MWGTHNHTISAIAQTRLRYGNHPAKVQSRDGVRQDADYLVTGYTGASAEV